MDGSDEQRRRFLAALGVVDRILVGGYRLLIGLVIAAVVAVLAFVLIRRPWGDGAQGEWFYFGAGVLLVLGWAVGRLHWLRGRERRRERGRSEPAFHASANAGDGMRTFEFRWGGLPAGDDAGHRFSRSIEIPLASLSADLLPDEDALSCLERELERGAALDDACALVQPAFVDWTDNERTAYRLYVANLLDQRRGRPEQAAAGSA